MPYLRSSRTRFRVSRPVVSRGGKVRSIQVFADVGVSPLGGVPINLHSDLATLIRAQIGLGSSEGYKLYRTIGHLCAYPQNAPAAGTRDDAHMYLIATKNAVPLANLDYTSITGGILKPLWFGSVCQPLTAASVGTNWTINTDLYPRTRLRSLMREEDDTIRLVFSSLNAGLNWHVNGTMRYWFTMP